MEQGKYLISISCVPVKLPEIIEKCSEYEEIKEIYIRSASHFSIVVHGGAGAQIVKFLDKDFNVEWFDIIANIGNLL